MVLFYRNLSSSSESNLHNGRPDTIYEDGRREIVEKISYLTLYFLGGWASPWSNESKQ